MSSVATQCPSSAAILELEGVCKSFGGTRALDAVSFRVPAGEVHALMGENGAGKSTLIKILGGVFAGDAGTVRFDGQEVRFHSTHQSQAAGISIIYQEFNLMPDLTVAENICVGREPQRFGLLDWPAMRRLARQALDELEVRIDPMALVGELTVAQKQMVEIAKALSIRAKFLVMDEPTAALSEQETAKLFGIIRSLRGQGKTILFVSHRLPEVFAVCDRVTVLRDGRFVATRPIGELDEAGIVQLMVGRDLAGLPVRDAATASACAFSVRDLAAGNTLQGISFEVRRGEILGIAGLMGSGRTELMEALYGLTPLDRGELVLEGRPVPRGGPRVSIDHGIGYLSEDRKSSGLFPGLSVSHNLAMTVLKRLARVFGFFLDGSLEAGILRDYTERLRIRYAAAGQKIESLSGGNQQKVLLSRALAADCRLLLLCEPTRGVDVGAKAEIHALMNELARKGVPILLSSSDLPELIALSDSCLVMRQGRAAAFLAKADITETTIIAHAAGGAQN